MKRRSFLQALLGTPFLALMAAAPRAPLDVPTLRSDAARYSDDLNTTEFAPVHDGNRTTGIEYP